MKSEYRSILAIALSAAAMIIWYTFFSPPKKPPEQTGQAVATQESQPAAKEASASAAADPNAVKTTGNKEPDKKGIADPQAQIPVKKTILETDIIKAEFTNSDAAPVTWFLKKYKRQASKTDDFIDLVSSEKGEQPSMQLKFLDANFEIPTAPKFKIVKETPEEVVYGWDSPEVGITKVITVKPGSYLADVSVTITNKTKRALNERPSLSWSGVTLPKESSGFFSFLKQPPITNKSPVYYLDGSVKRENNIAKIPASQEIRGNLYWAGLEDRYFLAAVVPREQSSQTSAEIGTSIIEGVKGGHTMYAGVALAAVSIPASEKITHNFSVYVGPKDIHQLKAVGVRLEEAIDYGWFTVIAMPILYLLKFFHGIVKNYGVAIILLTIFIKLLLHPINKKSMKSMKQMQTLQPRLKELQQKYANDKSRLNTETMQLFKNNKVNPMGGCLPMLLQFPIYIALYKVLWNSIELYQAPFFWFYKDLSAPDPYLITPIFLGIWMFLQQKLMPSTSADPAQQKMMMFMPIMFSVFMLFLPVGLTIYILINTMMSVVQQWMYNHNISFRDLLRGKWKPA